MAGDEAFDLTNISGLLKALESRNYVTGNRVDRIGAFDGTFCPSCGATRRMQLFSALWPMATEYVAEIDQTLFSFNADAATPAAFVARCLQCQEAITILVGSRTGWP